MSLAYEVLYALRFTPWEEIHELPGVREQFCALVEREERGADPPFGPALDVGCGSGPWAVELARRGWRVTGVDVVPRALGLARERAARAGVELQLVEGDVTRLADAGVGSGYALLLDFGLFHDELTDAQRAAMGREVTAVAAPGASLLMMAWEPRRRPLLPRGAGPSDLAAAYPEWDMVDEEPFDVSGSAFYRRVKSANPRFYRLRRRAPV